MKTLGVATGYVSTVLQTPCFLDLVAAAFALALVFGALSRFGPTEQWPWLAPVAIGMAAVALLSGVLLFWLSRRVPRLPATRNETQGDSSPILQAGRDVSYTSKSSGGK